MKEYSRAMDIMATGVFYAVKYGSKAMAVTSSEKPQPGGTIVVTASVAAAMGSFSDLCYCKLRMIYLASGRFHRVF